jgi:ribulose-phosphate 3-epimerase
MRRLVPAILTDKPQALASMVRQAEAFTSWVQFDIMDGLFVPSRSISSDDIAALRPQFDYAVHLMVRHPDSLIELFSLAGACRLTFHYEASDDVPGAIKHIKSLGMEAGLALNPETPTLVINDALAAELDVLLLLSVHPATTGGPLSPKRWTRLPALRRRYPNLKIGMDGGIKAGNIKQVAEAGVDEICVGSAVFGAPSPSEAYNELIALAEAGWWQTLK